VTADAPWEPPSGPQEPIVAFSRDVLGLPLWPSQAALLSELYGDGIRTGILRLGRRSGKGRMASVVATYEATVNAAAHTAAVPPGELVAVVVVANSQKQARIIHRFIRAYFNRPALSHLVVRDTEDEIELANGMVIVTMPCSARSARGYALAVVVFDEAAWFIDSDGSPMSGDELWSALVPGTAQFPAGKVLVLSTPRWSVGWFAELVAQASSGEFPDMRHWWAPTRVMNPTIALAFLEAERAKDPVSFAREYEARFDAGVGAAFDEQTVRAALRDHADEPARDGVQYVIAIDAAYTNDTFAVTLGHRDQAGVVVDRVVGYRGTPREPVNHRLVLDEVAAISKAYNHARVVLDQYASEPVAQGLVERGVPAIRRPWTNELKEEAVSELRQLFYGGNVELPRHPVLLAELIQLEQKPLPSGRIRIAAPPGGHDDYATALMALVHDLQLQPTYGDSFSMVA
jgi:hypothetical protein